MKKVSIESIKETLEILNHRFDLWKGESDVNHLIPTMINKLENDKKISLDDGAYVSNHNSMRPKLVIGFAAETNDLDKNAILKLKNKNCDWIIANDVSKKNIGFDSDFNEVTIHYKESINLKEKLSLKKKI